MLWVHRRLIPVELKRKEGGKKERKQKESQTFSFLQRDGKFSDCHECKAATAACWAAV